MASQCRRFEGKLALVTGGANGFGRATVQRLVDEGLEQVVVVDRDGGAAAGSVRRVAGRNMAGGTTRSRAGQASGGALRLDNSPASRYGPSFTIMKYSRLLLTLLLLAALSGCASLFNNKTPAVDIASNPTDASVYINGNYVGETPVTVDLSVRREHTITFRKEGYKDKSYQVHRSVGLGWIVLDLLGGLVGIIVDAAMGDWFMLDTEHVNVIMAPAS